MIKEGFIEVKSLEEVIMNRMLIRNTLIEFLVKELVESKEDLILLF